MQIDLNENMLTVRVKSSSQSISIKICWICPSISGLMVLIPLDVEDASICAPKSDGELGSCAIGVDGAQILTT